jgi:O-acetyl-ADP-ribose deacetylase (regulator of RNase III)
MAYSVHIKQGNLLDEAHADFIVNPSNTTLILGSGVSGAFSRTCGYALQSLMSQKLNETGTLKKGDVVATGGGECTRYKTVLHAAVMDYNPGAAETMPRLGDIRTILTHIETILAAEAARHGSSVKLVLPLMGTGVGGLSKKDVVEMYRVFFEREVAFECEVVLYAHSDSDRALMETLFSS